MSDLQAQFEAAAIDVKNLSERPENETLLELYAYYKQGSSGDAVGSRPGRMSFVKRAKWDAWNALAGTSLDDAMRHYVTLVARLRS